MVFNVNYDLTTGEIVSYQGGDSDDQNACPEGCATLTFKEPVAVMFDASNRIVMKVNVDTKQLEFIKPVVIPQPI